MSSGNNCISQDATRWTSSFCPSRDKYQILNDRTGQGQLQKRLSIREGQCPF